MHAGTPKRVHVFSTYHIQLAQDAWAAATNFVKKNRDHVIFNGCSPLDSPTGLNERRIVLFRMTAKKFSDVLGCRFKKQVDDYDDTDEGRLQQKRGRENLKLRMKNALGECKKRLSAVTYTRIVPISMASSNFNDPKPEQRWYTHIQLAQDAWAAATNFVEKVNP